MPYCIGIGYITRDDFESEIFPFQKNPDPYREIFAKEWTLMEILDKKYDETMENGHVPEYDDVLENEYLTFQKSENGILK